MLKQKISTIAIISLLVMASLSGCSAKKEAAAENKEALKINADGTKVGLGKDGLSVDADGAKVDVGKDGIGVNADGAKVDVGKNGISVDADGTKVDLSLGNASDGSDAFSSILTSALEVADKAIEADAKSTDSTNASKDNKNTSDSKDAKEASAAKDTKKSASVKSTGQYNMKDGLDLDQISQHYKKDIVPLFDESKILKSDCDKDSCYVTLITEKDIPDVSKFYSNAFKSVEGVIINSTANRYNVSGEKDSKSFYVNVYKDADLTMIKIEIL